ncbi:MAG: DNA primase [Planctomycetia bacterium]|nr:DNA primase [Planctomycetia bacterium]
MANSSLDLRERVRESSDIVSIVSQYVSLTQKGRDFVGRCPWHDDRRPSLTVNPDRQTFKCWVCDIGGDVFSFIMQMEGVDFRGALKILADHAGIDIVPKRSFPRKNVTAHGSMSGENGPFNGDVASDAGEIDKSTLYNALAWATQKYHEVFLNDPEAEGARAYIRNRGISEEMVRRFQIGYAPLRSDFLIGLSGNNRRRVQVLEAAGILTPGSRNVDETFFDGQTAQLAPWEIQRYYDRFRGRVLFPIRDTLNRTVALGGRVLPDSPLNSPAKYVNSPETRVFSKHKMLYGLDLARSGIRKSQRVIITEGYTDCVMAHQFGFPETVAVLGTALGAEHVRILKRFADRMILVLDGDAAGRKRAQEVLGFFVAQGVDVAILTLPGNSDPCEFLLANGSEAFESLLSTEAQDVMDYAFDTYTDGIDLDRDIVASTAAMDKLLAVLATCPTNASVDDPLRMRIEKALQRIAVRFRVRDDLVRQRLSELRARQTRSAYEPRANESNGPRRENEDRLVFPIGSEDESEMELREKFEAFPERILRDKESILMPNRLEMSFLEAWFACPEIFPVLADRVPCDLFQSPALRQLYLLGRDVQRHGEQPQFQTIMLRYESDAMKQLLLAVEDAISRKNLNELMLDEEYRNSLLEQVVAMAEKRKCDREEPKQVNALREAKIGSDEAQRKLLEVANYFRARQMRQNNVESKTVFMDDDGLSHD